MVDNIRKTYPVIDIMKFVFAIGIVALHAHPLRDLAPFADYMITQCFTRIGVPFFFVVAGFFLFGRMDRANLDKQRINKYIMRILKMLLAWTCFYLPIIIYEIMRAPNGIVRGGGDKGVSLSHKW